MVQIDVMPVRLKLVTPTHEIKSKIVRAMYATLIKRLSSGAIKNAIQKGAQKALEKSLKSQLEYLDMVASDGRLRAELGVVNSERVMNSLVRDWVRSTHVQIHRPRILGSSIVGTMISVKAIQADYQDVLERAYASYKTEKGDTIPWLEWLLTKGSEILVVTHRSMELPTARSRTGTNMIMIKSKGRGWGVPSEYAGTYGNNYATRAVLAAMPEIEGVFEREVMRRF